MTPGGAPATPGDPFTVVLGIAQDGGIPHAGSLDHPGWTDPERRHRVASLGIVDPTAGLAWMIDATPDFRDQLHDLQTIMTAAGGGEPPRLAGIFLTHAHIGHYTGLVFLGHEAMGVDRLPVYCMPRMADFLRGNGPWSELVRRDHVDIRPLSGERSVSLADEGTPSSPLVSVSPFAVPHRDECSETVGFRVEGPARSVVYIPDIDGWDAWEAEGTRVESVIANADIAYLDGTFYADGELPGRDMSTVPHPLITDSLTRFAGLPPEQRGRIRFIHFNHTNPAIDRRSEAHRVITSAGFGVAAEKERVYL